MALGKHFEAQLKRLLGPMSRSFKHQHLFSIRLLEKDGKWGYRIIRESHSDRTLAQWPGTTVSVNMQIYETPKLRFKSMDAALEDADKWLEGYKEQKYREAQSRAAS